MRDTPPTSCKETLRDAPLCRAKPLCVMHPTLALHDVGGASRKVSRDVGYFFVTQTLLSLPWHDSWRVTKVHCTNVCMTAFLTLRDERPALRKVFFCTSEFTFISLFSLYCLRLLFCNALIFCIIRRLLSI